VRWRYGAPSAVVGDALVRRYLPGERQALGQHFDVSAFATAIIPLNPGSYTGGLYLQAGPNVNSRRFVDFARGELLTHQFDVMHGVHVEAGERYSLVVWFSESEQTRAERTAPWVRRAAEGGNSDAQFILGGFHYRGEFGASRDINEAVRWFAESARGNNPMAMLWMATLYANGEGLPQDYDKAAEYWKAAAKQEHPSAQHALGWAYRDGLGVRRDKAAAVHWFRRAAAQGLERAADALLLGSEGWGGMSAAERARALAALRQHE